MYYTKNANKEEVKRAARGRWPEILATVGGLPVDVLDGKKHPCPKCGGNDRFRLIDADAGAVFCNQCFAKNNGDGFAAIRWATGCSFPEALEQVAEFLGIATAGPQTNRPQIDATYSYRNAAGELVFQALRMKPKGFRQRRPDGNGGWEWNAKGCELLPYRLPELLASDADKTVYVCEGEKDCDNLAALGLVATCNSGGAGKWKADHAKHLAGRAVVVVPDNDEAGRKHAAQVARSLNGIAESVRVVDLPDLPKKGDVSDWLKKYGDGIESDAIVADLEKLAAQAQEWQPGNRMDDLRTADLRGEEGRNEKEPPEPYHPFPTHLLPTALGDHVRESAAAIDCDASFVGLPVLAVCAAAIGNTRRVRIKKGWTEPSVLWCVSVCESGSKKSPGNDAAMQPLERRQQTEFANHHAAMAEFKKDKEERERAKKSEKKDLPELRELPVCRRFMVSDTTVEGLVPILQDNPRGVLLNRDELAGWFGSFDKYSSGKSDSAFWLMVHGARSVTVDRKTGEPRTLYVPRAAVSVAGTIQPGTLRRALGSEQRESGTAARLLLVSPPTRPKRWSEDEEPEAIAEAYDRAIGGLLSIGMVEDEEGRLEPVLVDLGREAKKAFIDFVNQHGAESDCMNGDMAAAYSKFEGAAARFALIFAMVEKETEVSGSSMRNAIELTGWFKREAHRVYAMLDGEEGDPAQRKLVAWIERKGGSVTARELSRGPRQYRENGVAEGSLQSLVDAGFGGWEVNGTEGRQRREFCLATVATVTQAPKTAETAPSVTVTTVTAPEVAPEPAPSEGWATI